MNKYWLVWNMKGITPSKQHPTYEAARAEAMRLALKHLGECFVVVESMIEFQTAAPEVISRAHNHVQVGTTTIVTPQYA